MPTHNERDASAHPFSSYLQSWLARTSLSAREMSRRAVDPESGQRVLHGYISALAAPDVPRAPDLWRIRAIAAAMASSGQPGERSYRAHLDHMKRLAAVQWLDLGEVVEVRTSAGDTVTVTLQAGLDLDEEGWAKVQEFAETLALARTVRQKDAPTD